MTVQDRLQTIFRDIFDRDDIEISPEMTAGDLREWDSLAHINLIIEIENQFEIKFTMTELQKLQNVGGMIELIEAKSD